MPPKFALPSMPVRFASQRCRLPAEPIRTLPIGWVAREARSVNPLCVASMAVSPSSMRHTVSPDETNTAAPAATETDSTSATESAARKTPEKDMFLLSFDVSAAVPDAGACQKDVSHPVAGSQRRTCH